MSKTKQPESKPPQEESAKWREELSELHGRIYRATEEGFNAVEAIITRLTDQPIPGRKKEQAQLPKRMWKLRREQIHNLRTFREIVEHMATQHIAATTER